MQTRGKIEYFCKYKGQAMPQRVYLSVNVATGDMFVDYDANWEYSYMRDDTMDEPCFDGKFYDFYFKAIPHPDFAEYVMKSVEDNYLKYLQDPGEAEFTAKVIMALVNDMTEDEDYLTWASAGDYFQDCKDSYDDKIKTLIDNPDNYFEVISWIDDDCYQDGQGVYIYDLETWLDERIEFLKGEIDEVNSSAG